MLDEALFYLALITGALLVIAYFALPIDKYSIARGVVSQIVSSYVDRLPSGSVLKVFSSTPFEAHVKGTVKGTCLAFYSTGEGVVVEGC